MKVTSLALAASFLVMSAVAPAFSATAMSEADCTAWLAKVNQDNDGMIDGVKQKGFKNKLEALNIRTKDKTSISKDEFMSECMKGNFEGVEME